MGLFTTDIELLKASDLVMLVGEPGMGISTKRYSYRWYADKSKYRS